MRSESAFVDFDIITPPSKLEDRNSIIGHKQKQFSSIVCPFLS